MRPTPKWTPRRVTSPTQRMTMPSMCEARWQMPSQAPPMLPALPPRSWSPADIQCLRVGSAYRSPALPHAIPPDRSPHIGTGAIERVGEKLPVKISIKKPTSATAAPVSTTCKNANTSRIVRRSFCGEIKISAREWREKSASGCIFLNCLRISDNFIFFYSSKLSSPNFFFNSLTARCCASFIAPSDFLRIAATSLSGRSSMNRRMITS